jgi:hypothetical protein
LQHGSAAAGGGIGMSAARAAGDAMRAASAARVGIAKRLTMIVPHQIHAHPERDDEEPCQQIVKWDLTVFFNDDF